MSLIAENISISVDGTDILRQVSLILKPGQFLVLIGPNGAGKSTLLKALSGDISVSRGYISMGGRSLEKMSATEQARLRSVMSQSPYIEFDFLVEEILRMGWIHTKYEDFSVDFALEYIIDLCGIWSLIGRRFKTLSGGEQQRVQFARALLQIWNPSREDTRYLLLDEPTSSLDLCHEIGLLSIAKQQTREGAAVIAVLHDLTLAARFADDIILLSEGQVVAKGAVQDVLNPKILTDVYKVQIYVDFNQEHNRIIVHS